MAVKYLNSKIIVGSSNIFKYENIIKSIVACDPIFLCSKPFGIFDEGAGPVGGGGRVIRDRRRSVVPRTGTF